MGERQGSVADLVERALKKEEEDPGLTVDSLEEHEILPSFTSRVTPVTVTLTSSDGKCSKRHLVVKRLVDKERWGAAFRNECLWYQELGWRSLKPLYTSHSLLIFPDIRHLGFAPIPPKRVTISHLRLALQELAEIHACSIRLKERDRRRLEEVGARLEEVGEMRTGLVQSLSRAGKVLTECGEPEAGRSLVGFTARHLRRLLTPQPDDSFTVICHGDYWANNLLFRLDGSETMAVDWQGARLGPAAQDILTLLCTSGYQNEADGLCKCYHERLRRCLDSSPSFQELLQHVESHRLLGLLFGVFYLPAVALDGIDSTSLGRLSEDTISRITSSPFYRERLLKLAQSFELCSKTH